jgi:outer membrane receptor for ferrienterochelin and colicin
MRRIGYAALDYDFWFPDSATTVDVELTAEPLATRLPDIQVEGEMMILGGRRLAGFERRRKGGGGHFLTEKDIRKIDARATSEILRRVPGVIIRRTAIGTQVDLQASGKMCPAPVIYLDGTRVATDDVNMIVLPESLVGVEVYRSSTVVPPEFNIQNLALSSNCGVIAFWTR